MLNLKEINPIGIDVTDQALYAAQFQNTRQGKVVRHLAGYRLAAGAAGGEPNDDLIPALKTVAKARRFQGKVVNLLLPEQHVNCFLVSFDLGSDENLEDAIAKECRRSLSFPLEEAVVDYASLLESQKKKRRYKVAIVAVRRDIVSAYINLARKAGLSVGVIDLHLSAMLRLHQFLFPLTDTPVLLCNVDDTTTLLSVVTKQRILAQRQASWGIRPILKRLTANLELDEDEGQAAAMLARYGLMHEKLSSATGRPPAIKGRRKSEMAIYRTLFRLLIPYVEELIHELYQITGYVRSEMDAARFDEIVLYGWASDFNYLDQYIEKRLNIPTKAINPMTKLSWGLDSPDLDDIAGAPFAPALGLALRKVSWL
jgi:type IV pilus assembly protein PilM